MKEAVLSFPKLPTDPKFRKARVPPREGASTSGSTVCRVAGRHIIAESVRGRGKTPGTPPSIVEMILVTFGKFHILRFFDSENRVFASHDGESKGRVLEGERKPPPGRQWGRCSRHTEHRREL